MDLITMGELLIDFTDIGRSSSGMRIFEQNPGGAVANVACAAAALGLEAGFIGKIGTDMHGRFLKETLNKRGVDTTGLIEDDKYFTTLAFVELGENGERTFSFARKPGADTQLKKEELPFELLKNVKVFGTGSLSLTAEPVREATYEAVKKAKQNGAVIAYDPNYRAPLWENEKDAVEKMRSLLEYTDMIKISDEETSLLTGKKSPEKAIEALTESGIKVAAVTLGQNGALVRAKGETVHVPGFSVKAVDTTGAGDAFWGGFIYSFITAGKKADDLTANDAAAFAFFANAAAACCVTKNGGIPAMPDKNAVSAMMGQ